MSMNPRKEKADLLNMHKFISKHLEVLANESIETFENNTTTIEESGKRIEEAIIKAISEYPKQLNGVTDDLWFYMQIMKHLTSAVVTLNTEAALKKYMSGYETEDIERQLNKMLGIK